MPFGEFMPFGSVLVLVSLLVAAPGHRAGAASNVAAWLVR
jgi:apolipoprotein N-acyltransferase